MVNLRPVTRLWALALVLAPSTVSAQGLEQELPEGSRIRWTMGHLVQTGTLDSIWSSGLKATPLGSKASVTLLFRDVDALEVRRRGENGPNRGARTGFLTGGLIGGTVACVLANGLVLAFGDGNTTLSGKALLCAVSFPVGFLAGSVPGVVLGGAIGEVARSQTWEKVELPGKYEGAYLLWRTQKSIPPPARKGTPGAPPNA